MSRSGYIESCDFSDNWQFIMYRGAVNSAIKGRRGQKLLSDLALCMDSMKDKILISDELESNGSYCALGVVGVSRSIDMSNLDPEDRENVAKAFDIAESLAAEIVFMNDEGSFLQNHESPSQRWTRMRKWVDDNLINERE